MRLNNVELKVIVKDKTITEYYHNGQTFIEGREGSNFEIVVTNHNPFRVEAVVSVDGLSILDGKDAGPQSDGYLLNARETIAIPGWKLNEAQVAAFQFAGKGGSYAALSTGTARNTGVIGLLVYRERNHVPVNRTYIPNAYAGVLGGPTQHINTLYAATAVPPDSWNTMIGGGLGITTCSATVGTSMNCADSTPLMAMAAMAPQSMARGVKGARGDQGPTSPGVFTTEIDQSYAPAAVQNLGTGFGEAQTFATQTVSFARGDMHAMLVLYYDNARGLKARGIVLVRSKKDKVLAAPNAFPGMSGCTPPPGWQG